MSPHQNLQSVNSDIIHAFLNIPKPFQDHTPWCETDTFVPFMVHIVMSISALSTSSVLVCKSVKSHRMCTFGHFAETYQNNNAWHCHSKLLTGFLKSTNYTWKCYKAVVYIIQCIMTMGWGRSHEQGQPARRHCGNLTKYWRRLRSSHIFNAKTAVSLCP